MSGGYNNHRQTKLSPSQQQLRQRLIASMERRPGRWQEEFLLPAVDAFGKPFTGESQLLLSSVAYERAYQDSRWYTFDEIRSHRKDGWWLSNASGQGVPISVYFPRRIGGPRVSWQEWRQAKDKNIYYLDYRTALLFNAELIENIPPEHSRVGQEAVNHANELLQNYLQQAQIFPRDGEDSFHYYPETDSLTLPDRPLTEDELGTAFREVAVSTVHSARLGERTDIDLALVAQLGGIMLCSQTGIFPRYSNNRETVLQWAKGLREHPEQITRAINRARKSTNYILTLANNAERSKNHDLRENAENLHGGESSGRISEDESQRNAGSLSKEVRGRGVRERISTEVTAGEGPRRDRGNQTERSTEMGGNDEQLPIPGQGNGDRRDGGELKPDKEENVSTSGDNETPPDVSPTKRPTANSFSYQDYLRVKREYPNTIVLYQAGDFFLMCGEDAKLAAKLLQLHLFSRSTSAGERIEMCGVPADQLDQYTQRLRSAYAVTISGIDTQSGQRQIIEMSLAPQAGETVSEAVKTENTVPPRNFHITDFHLGEGGAKAKFRRNIDAINLLKEMEFDGRQATPDEQETLSRYVGWGGLADAFDEAKGAWADEFQELYTVLSPEEYASARASTLNAHYTSPAVIQAIYEAVGNMGFQAGNILEPACGIGNFFGMLPDMMANSKLYGVELDSISGRIAKQLYPQANITVAGFETTSYRDFFDLAVGNVPFGQYQVNDPTYNKLGFSIHNYFFAKTLDAVRPGGIVAFITSRYTMDAKNPTARKYIAQRAELLGAIRLPNNAFRANAGTDVVSDILFLQKRERPIVTEPDWVHLNQTEQGYAINEYFVDHPEMILGELTSKSTQYGQDECTVAPIPGADLAQQLHQAIQRIHGEYVPDTIANLEDEPIVAGVIPADPAVRNYSYAVVNDTVYYRENSIMRPVELDQKQKDRLTALIQMRDITHELIDLQTENRTDAEIHEKQTQLNKTYDAFVEQFGHINQVTNGRLMDGDSSYNLLCSLENVDEEGHVIGKADMFFKRTIYPHVPITHADTAEEALAVSIGEHGKVDLPYMAQLTGKSEDVIINNLAGIIFRDIRCPEDPAEITEAHLNLTQYPFVSSDEYLSGNVRHKLRMAEAILQALPEEKKEAVRQNVASLETVQPKDLEATEIEVHLGADWIDPKYIQQFMWETFKTPFYRKNSFKVHYSAVTATWEIEGKSYVPAHDVSAFVTYGTQRANAYKILEDTLNLRDEQIFDTVEIGDGKTRRVLNAKETTLACQKQQLIKEAFNDWIWKDPQRRSELLQVYNERFNSIRPREYDGKYLRFHGMNAAISLRPHQKNAVARILYGGNTLLAHEVGAGKTFTAIAGVMESKRLGLCHKACFAVPNHLTEQWASDFLRLYPAANIMVTTRKDFTPDRRKKFCARIATGDYDAVIVGHSQFEKIPVSKERQEAILEQQLQDVLAGIEEVKASKGEHFTIKQLEKTRKSLQLKLEKLRADHRKDDVVTFEQLGVDRLIVDESQNYKNLYFYTKMRNVAGLATTEAQKSSDMFMKCRYMDELTGSKGVIFATGTPVSNSMTELYSLQLYLQYYTLAQMKLLNFDSWVSTFGKTVTSVELAPEGTGYRMRTRLSWFYNLPELMTMFREVADIQTADQLNLPTPRVKTETVVVEPSEIQREMVQQLSKRASDVHSRMVDPSVDNMLRITSDGRKIGLDQRLMNPLLPDDPNSKVNACVKNVLRIWKEGKADRLTQLIFCDLSTPKSDGKFNVYADMRKKFVDAGVPESEIAFIHSANTEVKKKKLFAQVRAGTVRILMGSTSKMGAGTNVQDKLIAVHHLDVGWRPSDMTQRNGRIVRQGNQNPEVQIYQYVTKGTFDAYLWQTLENKQKFISQIMTNKSPMRSCENIDEQILSFAEVKALCAENPLIKEKMDLEIEVSKLRTLQSSWKSQHFRLEDQLLHYFPSEIRRVEATISGLESDIQLAEQYPMDTQSFAITVQGKTYTQKKQADDAILSACQKLTPGSPVELGNYRGFSMRATLDMQANLFVVSLSLAGSLSYPIKVQVGAKIFTRLDNVLADLPKRLATQKSYLTNLTSQKESAKVELEKPFAQEKELKEKSARLAELSVRLNLDANPTTQSVEQMEQKPDMESQVKPCYQEVR